MCNKIPKQVTRDPDQTKNIYRMNIEATVKKSLTRVILNKCYGINCEGQHCIDSFVDEYKLCEGFLCHNSEVNCEILAGMHFLNKVHRGEE